MLNLGKTCVLWYLLLAVFCIAFIQNLTQLVILRIVMGVLYGLMLPLSQILIAEITPICERGRFQVGLQISFLVGSIWTILLGYLFLDNLMEGNWRILSLCNVIPCVICLIGCVAILKESPRFLICIGQIEEGIKVVNHLGLINDPAYEELSEESIQELLIWREETFQTKLETKSFLNLFDRENLQITWRSYLIMILIMGVDCGISIILPFLLDSESMGLTDMLFTVLAELPSVILVYCSIDQWGRLPIAFWSNSINLIAIFIILYWKQSYLLIGLLLFRFLIRCTMLAIMPLILESYSTLYRSLGVGSTFALGRIMGCIVPIFIFPLYETDHYYPFAFSFICIAILSGILFSYPRDTVKRPLDEDKKMQ